MTKHISPEQLRQMLEQTYPVNATCWSQATDEVRDLCRYARNWLELDEEHAVDFRVLKTPSQWNTFGINGIINFYSQMSHSMQCDFINDFGHLASEE